MPAQLNRTSTWLCAAAAALAFVLAIGYWKGENLGGRDITDALAIIRVINDGEKRCLETEGHYVAASDLKKSGCAGVDLDGIRERCRGFSVRLTAQGSSYSLAITPESVFRIRSAYSDQNGAIKFGWR